MKSEGQLFVLIGVFVNLTYLPERRASTMMHELAHIELKHVPIGVDISSIGILLVSEYSEDNGGRCQLITVT